MKTNKPHTSNVLYNLAAFEDWTYTNSRWKLPLKKPSHNSMSNEVHLDPGVSDLPTWHPLFQGPDLAHYNGICRSIWNPEIFWHIHDLEKIKLRVESMILFIYNNRIFEPEIIKPKDSLHNARVYIGGRSYTLTDDQSSKWPQH